MNLNVFLNAYGNRQFVGILAEKEQHIFFQYAPDFLTKGINLSPFMLPLKPDVFEDEKRTFDGLFGLFNDSLPDGWGCLLLDRKLMKQGRSYHSITPLERLAMIGKNPMGALEYEPANGGDNIDKSVELDTLATEADNVISGHPTEVLDELLKLNGSSGGAHPKIVANVSDDKNSICHGDLCSVGYTPWLIKFANASDRKDVGVQEYIYSLMAQKAGIDMPETHLFPSTTSGGHFGVQRFDRILNQKVHIHTACGLLHASHRFSSIDYETLLKLTWRLTGDYQELLKMARLMIFNVKSGNKDDHSKNFAFMLHPDNQWKMAPAYDLTPSEGINGEQTSMVNGKGKDITDADFFALATKFDIDKAIMQEMIDIVDAALAEYPTLMKQFK